MQAMIAGEALSAKPAASSTVTWREPVEIASFGRASVGSANGSAKGHPVQSNRPMSGSARGSGPPSPTATPSSFGLGEANIKNYQVENGGQVSSPGIPESVMIVPMEDVATSAEFGATKKVIRSRGRPRRPEEPTPFLSVDTLPVDKVVVDGKTSVSSPTKTCGRPSSGPTGGRRFTGSPKKYQSQINLNSSMNSSIGGRKTPQTSQKQGSRPSSKTSSMANYNSFFTHKNAAFLSGPPSLWSVGNKYWPHQNSPPTGRKGAAFPPVMVVEGNSTKPNQLVTQPFKHDVDAPLLTERSVSPSLELKENTLQAVRDVAKDLYKRNSPPTTPTRSGRLLKGKLKPLHTFKLQGPSIDECKGIQAEERPSFTPSQARMLQRKRELLSMLPPDPLHQRPMTHESFHHTSIASNLSDDRTNELQSPIRMQDTIGELPANAAMPQMSAFTRMPPNSLASFESASDGMSPVPSNTMLVEIPTHNNNEYIKSSYDNEAAGDNNDLKYAPPEATMSYYLNEGGAASILSDMVDRVKHSTQRVSEEVAEAVEGAFHQSMLVNSEPPLSRSETPANRSMVSDDGLLESASQRSVRFSDNDSFIDNDPSVDSGRGGVGPGSDVLDQSSRGTPTQDVDVDSVRNETPTQDEPGHEDAVDQSQPSTNNIEEQNQDSVDNDREVLLNDSQSDTLQQVEPDQIEGEKELTNVQVSQETEDITLGQNVDDVKTSEDYEVKSSPEATRIGISMVKDSVDDNNIKEETDHTKLGTNELASNNDRSDVVQHEQEHKNDQYLSTDQDMVPVESISKVEQDALVDEEAGANIIREQSIQKEQQHASVVSETHNDDNLSDKQHEQNQNSVSGQLEQKQSAENASNEQNITSAINVDSEPDAAESKVTQSEQDEPKVSVLPEEMVDADPGSDVIDEAVSDATKLDDDDETNANPSRTSASSDPNQTENKEDQSNADKNAEITGMEGELKQKEEEEEESKQGESCNKKSDEDVDKKDDDGDGGSSGSGGGAGENGHSGNNDGGSNAREDDHDKGGQDECGQGDGNHGNSSHGNEESDVKNENNENNFTQPQDERIVKHNFSSNDYLFNRPSKPKEKKVAKCWYGDLEDDVPEIEDSVLFCGICGLDEDTCVCPHSSLAPNRTQSAFPTHKKMGTNEAISTVSSANRLFSAPGAMQGNQISTPDEFDLSSTENKIILEYKSLLGQEAGSGCFSSELTPRNGGSVKQSNVHFLLRGLPVVSGEAGHEDDRCGNNRKEEDTIVDSGCESEQMDDDPVHGDEGVSQGDLNGADPSTLEVVAKPKTLSRPRSAKNKPASMPAPFPPVCFRINVRPPAGKLFYFAYGVDMNPKRMATYLGSTVERRWGVLFGFKLKFNKRGSDLEAGGFPNIEFDPESSVEGCVYVITPAQLKTLDMFMGSPQYYIHAMFPVWMSNCYQPEQFGVAQYCVAALTYVALDKWTHTDTSKPLSCHYSIEQCLKGSDLLTTDYIQHMKAQLVT